MTVTCAPLLVCLVPKCFSTFAVSFVMIFISLLRIVYLIPTIVVCACPIEVWYGVRLAGEKKAANSLFRVAP